MEHAMIFRIARPRITIHAIAVFLLLSIALSTSVGAEKHAIEMKDVSRVVRRHVPIDSHGGIGVLVARNGNVIHCLGYGTARGAPLTTQSGLSLASVTKQFAAMGAAMLIEEGKLELKQKVSHYLPDLKLPMKRRALLVQDLVWHVSGLPNFINKEEKTAIAGFKKQRGLDYLTNKTHAQWLATMPIKRAPGQTFEYTNSGYVLLARIIEVVAGESFHDFQRRSIFDVLGMTRTTDSTRFNGSGNMRTTLLDYAKWDKALWEQDTRLLSAKGYQMLFSQGKLDAGTPVDYGFGWRVTYRDGKLIYAEHGGVGSGKTAARNLIKRFAADQTTVAIFAQEIPTIGRAKRAAIVNEIYKSVSRQK